MMGQHNCISDYLAGNRLYGDDLDESGIQQWYRDEAEAYANLGAKDRASYSYKYHALNEVLGYRILRGMNFQHVLGLGSAYGDEFQPIIRQIERITILEPSDAFPVTHIEGVPVFYEKPRPSGDIPFDDGSFDLIMCFGVLHHIPNVTHVLGEISRCLSEGGILLIREPTVSMGDWTKPRPGLTSRERGIPAKFMAEAIRAAGLQVLQQTPFGFTPLRKIWKAIFRGAFYNSAIAVRLDTLASRAMTWNYSYHRTGVVDRFAPSSTYWVLKKSDVVD